jgi:hypothetical protein
MADDRDAPYICYAAGGQMGLTLQAATGRNLQDGLIFSSMKYAIDVTHQRDESYADIG